jgi:predicted Zn-dependent protease
MAYSVAFEQEADYVGLYFMTRAGYDSAGAENFWRRMAAENPRNVTAARTHPTTPERFLALAATRDEIAEKQANGLALTPDLDRDAIRARRAAAEAAAEDEAETVNDVAPAQNQAPEGGYDAFD